MTVILRVFLPFAFGYVLSYLLRVINAVAGEPIARDLDLTPGELGLLTSLFFAGFGIAQIPLGILMDRYGPRRVEGVILVFLAAGAGLFSVASTFTELAVGRFMMGFGASLCLMAPLTAYRYWFDARKLPLVNGLHLSCGAIGGALGGGPTDRLIDALGWQPVFAILGGLVLLASLAILRIVPSEREPTGRPSLVALSRQIHAIVTARAFWRIAPLSAASQATLLSIGSLWTGPWLLHVASLPPSAAAGWLSVFSLSLVIGFVGCGFLMNRANSQAGAERIVALALFAFVLVQGALVVLPPELGTPLWILYNVIGSASALTYAIVVPYFQPGMAGRVNTTMNFVVFLAAFLTQWLFGVLLDFYPDGTGGVLPAGYATGFLILMGVQLAAFVPWLLLKPEPATETAGSAAR